MFLDGLVDHMVDPIVSILGKWAGDINIYSIIIRVVLAVLIGGLIGAERSTKHHVAGLRTHILVCLGACVAMMTNEFICPNADASRMAAGVLTGTGFLGAGTILVTSRSQVKGLTTAAALWATGAVGLAVGIAFYTLALISTFFIMISLIFLPKFERRLQVKSRAYDIHVELFNRTDLKELLEFIRSKDLLVRSIALDASYANSGLSVYSISLFAKKTESGKHVYWGELVTLLKELEYVHYVEFMG